MAERHGKQVPIPQQKNITKILKSEQGQTLVEYALLIVLIAFVTVLAMQSLGIAVSNSFSKVDNALSTAMTGSSSSNISSNENSNNGNGNGNANNNGNNGNGNNGNGGGKGTAKN